MVGLGLPTWGIATLVGLPLTILLYIMLQFFKGEFVHRRHLESVQKVADSWQHAWDVSQQTQAEQAAAINRMTELSDVFEHFIKSLPRPEGPEKDTR